MRSPTMAGIATCLLACGISTVSFGEEPVQAPRPAPGQLVDAPPKSAQGRPKADNAEQSKPTLSPLHTFLGIDPNTDSFTRPGNRKKGSARQDQTQKSGVASTQLPADSDKSAKAPVGAVTDDPAMSTVENAQEMQAAIVNALQQGDPNSLLALFPGFSQGPGYERLMETTRRFSLLIYVVVFAYPLYLVLVESAQWLMRRFGPALTNCDKRYFSSRMRRRLLLAATSASTIALLCWGSVNSFWWQQPRQLATFVTAAIVLLITSAVLRQLIRSAAVHYPVLAMRELQAQHLQLQGDVEELRRRLHCLRVGSGI